MVMSCCAARPKNKRAASSPGLLLGKQAENGMVEIRKAPKPIEKEKLDYAVEDYNHVPALTIPTESPESVLGLAAQGDATVLRFVIKSKSDQAEQLVNEQDSETGTTPLLAAAKGGHTGCIEVLLEHGADVLTLCNGETARMVATRRGHTAVAARQAGVCGCAKCLAQAKLNRIFFDWTTCPYAPLTNRER